LHIFVKSTLQWAGSSSLGTLRIVAAALLKYVPRVAINKVAYGDLFPFSLPVLSREAAEGY